MADFEPYKGARSTQAWDAAAALLREGDWITRSVLVDAMLDASDLKRNSCEQMLTSAMKAGWLYSASGNRVRVTDPGRRRRELRRPEDG